MILFLLTCNFKVKWVSVVGVCIVLHPYVFCNTLIFGTLSHFSCIYFHPTLVGRFCFGSCSLRFTRLFPNHPATEHYPTCPPLHSPSSILKICHACFDLHARTFVDNKVGVQTHEHSPSREADGKISREQGRRLNRLRKIGRRSSAY